ncbi:MAG: tRNA pseudouridine(55) synthase TruB [Firmicutes bacterium]|nr:tRNA pseudouridine(55) synthase TruB [Bacillota bacterium]
MDYGIIVINKPAGFTSHDVIAIMRGITGIRKMGHTGTLDPNATGVLPVCFGKATKLIEYMDTASKTYEAGIRFGLATVTQDIWGDADKDAVPEGTRRPVPSYAEEISAVLDDFRGSIDQIPPAYSAVFVNGRRAYDIARGGGKPKLEPRKVTIHSIELLEYDPKTAEGRIRVCCSRGTYIRTICHDIGLKLGCGACLSSLTRTEACGFTLQDALDLNDARNMTREEVLKHVRPVEDALGQMPKLNISEEASRRYLNGATIKMDPEGFAQNEPTAVYCSGVLLGISMFTGDSLVPVKVFS